MPGQSRSWPEWLERLGGRRAGARLANLLPERLTALRTPPDRVPPPPRSFGSFGEGSWVVPTTRIARSDRVRIGSATVVMEESHLSGTGLIDIGERVILARYVSIHSDRHVAIGDDVLTSDYVGITDSWGPGGGHPEPVVIEDGAYLGAGCIVGPGARVGAGAFVGEGAVVFGDVPPHSVVYGNPATVARRFSGARWE